MISGTSLSDLLASPEKTAEPAAEAEPEPAAAAAPFEDAACAEKLEQARERILELIKSRRPRFVPAFERMKFRNNAIQVSVPTRELHDEIVRNRTAMLIRIAELAGVMCPLRLEVTVNESIRASRPIKPEDKVKYLTEKNPVLTDLRKALDLEME
ncbi:MAG: DNA polymerase III subunit gamma/tau [Alistipes sp.]|nr:DNA polymerase III subunit gamma/tau [Alistipes sp.]